MITLFRYSCGLSAGLTALALFAIALCSQNDALAADIVLRVGDQKGGNRSLWKFQDKERISRTRSNGLNFPQRPRYLKQSMPALWMLDIQETCHS